MHPGLWRTGTGCSPNIDADTVRRYVLLAASLKGEVVAAHALPEHLREKASALMSSVETRRARARRSISNLAVPKTPSTSVATSPKPSAPSRTCSPTTQSLWAS